MMTPHQTQFLKLMDEIVRLEGYRTFEAFSAFLELAFRATAGVTLVGDAWRKNEDAYLSQVNRFDHQKETAEACANALGVLIEGLEKDREDFLGPIFMEMASNKHTGQFFTPWSLCLTMAEISIDEHTVEIAQHRVVTFSEPACGCAGMALATAEVLKRRGINPATRFHFTLEDIDIRCVQAAYIQATLCGLSATVIHGNTISLETWGSWQTFTAFMFPKRIRQPDAPADTPQSKHPNIDHAAAPAPIQRTPDTKTGKPLQLSFF